MRVFLACSMTGYLAESPAQREGYFSRMKALCAFLRKGCGASVFCAFEDEQWGLTIPPLEEIVKRDFRELDVADIVLLYLERAAFTSALIEVGWASGKGIPILTCYHKSIELPALLVGLEHIHRAVLLPFVSIEDAYGDIKRGLAGLASTSR